MWEGAYGNKGTTIPLLWRAELLHIDSGEGYLSKHVKNIQKEHDSNAALMLPRTYRISELVIKLLITGFFTQY